MDRMIRSYASTFRPLSAEGPIMYAVSPLVRSRHSSSSLPRKSKSQKRQLQYHTRFHPNRSSPKGWRTVWITSRVQRASVPSRRHSLRKESTRGKRRRNEELTQRCPTAFTPSIDASDTVHFTRGVAAFAKPSHDVQVSLVE